MEKPPDVQAPPCAWWVQACLSKSSCATRLKASAATVLSRERGRHAPSAAGAAPAAEVVAVDPDQVFVDGTGLCVRVGLESDCDGNLPWNPRAAKCQRCFVPASAERSRRAVSGYQAFVVTCLGRKMRRPRAAGAVEHIRWFRLGCDVCGSAQDLGFGVEPIIEVVAVLAAAFHIDFKRKTADLFSKDLDVRRWGCFWVRF